jgi:hypothetical protein
MPKTLFLLCTMNIMTHRNQADRGIRAGITSLLTLVILAVLLILSSFLLPRNREQLPALEMILNFVVVVAGLWLLREVLRAFFSDPVSAITLAIVVLGTNYFQLVTGSSPFPVNVLFALVSLVVFLTIRWHRDPTYLNSVLLGLATGAAILVNPSDAVILLVPVFWNIHSVDSMRTKGKWIRQHRGKAYAFLGSLVAALVTLFLFWNPLSGFFSYSGYSQHGVFYLIGLFFPQVVFSLKNGWLVYTPVMAVAILGFYLLASRNPALFFSAFLFFFLSLVVISSWNTYAFADEFGRKGFIPSYAILALPLGYVVQWIHERKIHTSLPLFLLLLLPVLLNLFQTWQYRKSILITSVMTPEYYETAFGRTRLPETELLTIKGFEPSAELFLRDESRFRRKMLASYGFEDTTVAYRQRLDHRFFHSGQSSFRMDTGSRFTPGIRMKYAELIKEPRAGLRISCFVYGSDTATQIPASLVITSLHEGILYRYRTLDLDGMALKPRTWNRISLAYITPEDPLPDDEIQAYFYYRGNSVIYVDDLTIGLYEPLK